jgi:hypothetical protein
MKCFDVRECIKRHLRPTVSVDEVEDVTDRIAVKVIEKTEIWSKSRKDKYALLDKYSRSPYKKFHESKGPLNQIRVMGANRRSIDLAEFSPIVRAIRPFQLARYYLSEGDTEGRSALEEIIKGETSR